MPFSTPSNTTSSKTVKRTPAAQPVLDRTGAEPLYRQLAGRLLEAIESGRFATGDRLPSEPQLMAQYGLSRITVRQAIALLVRSGKLSAHRGKGTFVAGRVVQHDLDALQGFYEALRSQGIEPQTQLLEWSTRAGALDDQRPVGLDLPVRLKRLYAVDGRPFALVVGYLPAAAGAVGKARAARLNVYEILSQFMGVRVAHAAVTIRCERAAKDIAALLGLKRSDSVLVMERESFTQANQSCEFMRIYIVPEHYEFRLRVAGQLEIARAVHPIA